MFFLLSTEGSLVSKRDLLALYLSETYCHRTGTRPPSCVTPRQQTIYGPRLGLSGLLSLTGFFTTSMVTGIDASIIWSINLIGTSKGRCCPDLIVSNRHSKRLPGGCNDKANFKTRIRFM